MPQTAAFIDALRREFGAAGINARIRDGMAGQADSFYARENGLEVGVAFGRHQEFEHDGDRWVRVA